MQLKELLIFVTITLVSVAPVIECFRFNRFEFNRPVHKIKDFITRNIVSQHQSAAAVQLERERRFIGPDAEEAAKIRDMIFKIHKPRDSFSGGETKSQLTSSAEKRRKSDIVRPDRFL